MSEDEKLILTTEFDILGEMLKQELRKGSKRDLKEVSRLIFKRKIIGKVLWR